MAQNSLVQSNQGTKLPFSVFLSGEKVKTLVETSVGKNAQRFTAAIISAVSANPMLQECANQTILSAALLGEALNLSPSPQLGQYAIVPYKDKKRGMIAQFQLMYKGYIQLAIRSGQYRDIDVVEIKEGEYLGRDGATGKHQFNFIQNYNVWVQKKTIGYVAWFELLNGFRKAIYWSIDEMINHADRYVPAFSKNGGFTANGNKKVSFYDYLDGKYDKKDEYLYSSPWYSSFGDMAKKTMIRQLISKWGVMSIEMQQAFESDDKLIEENGVASFGSLDADESVVINEVAPAPETKAEEKKAAAPVQEEEAPAAPAVDPEQFDFFDGKK